MVLAIPLRALAGCGEIPFINPGDGELCWVHPWWSQIDAYAAAP